MIILNLGCGTRTSDHPAVLNVDWSIMLRIRINPLLRRLAPLLLNADRLQRFRRLPANLRVHDLARGIPFPDNSVDVVYHSHVLEHLDRNVARSFICENKRVLRPGGIIRVVVPDFERGCREYLRHVQACEEQAERAIAEHDCYLEPLLAQSVQREASGTSQQRPLRRYIENRLLGDARRRGHTHQWMYDRFNLRALLELCGFRETRVQTFNTSEVARWGDYLLDSDNGGEEYRPGSLYMEARV